MRAPADEAGLQETPGRWDACTPSRRTAGQMRDDEVSARERRRLGQ